MEIKLPDQVNLEKVEHIGIVVRDIDKVTESWSSLFGLGPWTIREMGGGPVKMKMAFASLGALQIELIQPVEGRIFHSEFLDIHGEGLHHLGFSVDDLDDAVSKLVAQGAKVVSGGQGNFVYLETGGPGGVIFELVKRRA